jgi:dolichol-phosphate mannosyltransferase
MSSSLTKIGCVIPCFYGGATTLRVISECLNYVDTVVLVDDSCPLHTGKLALQKFGSNKAVAIITSNINSGVGGSTKKGIDYLIKSGCNIVVKIDADGQMPPSLIPALISPIIQGSADAAKGNRFTSLDHMLNMPFNRLLGNLSLSFLNKLSSGYWELFDPTNGFLAFHKNALDIIRLDKVDNRYFFESDLLFQCCLANINFAQLPMESRYCGEVSSLRPLKEVFRFAQKHICNFLKRLVYRYFILDFNVGSLELMGTLMAAVSLLFFSCYIIIRGLISAKLATLGEVGIIGIFALIMIQFGLSFLYFDATHQPLMRRLNKM